MPDLPTAYTGMIDVHEWQAQSVSRSPVSAKSACHFQRLTSQVLSQSSEVFRSFSSLELSNLPFVPLPSLPSLHSVHSPTFSRPKLTNPTAKGNPSWGRQGRPCADSSQFSPGSSQRLLQHMKNGFFPGDEKPKSQRVKTGWLHAL